MAQYEITIGVELGFDSNLGHIGECICLCGKIECSKNCNMWCKVQYINNDFDFGLDMYFDCVSSVVKQCENNNKIKYVENMNRFHRMFFKSCDFFPYWIGEKISNDNGKFCVDCHEFQKKYLF